MIRNRGMALLIVLACLVLVSVLVISFLTSVGTELKSSKSYAEGSSVRHLADSAIQIATGQIRDGTSGRDAVSQRIAWASQPGMIRTFDTAGLPSAYYKLYSSGTMAGVGGFPGEAISATWDTDTGLYVDLNEPSLGRYPILDPAGIGKVEGFAIDVSDGAVSGKTNAAPMPVKWLYVLEDGTFTVPSGGGGALADFSASHNKPTSSNPLVGRVAFWTDDETSKVNINTASEGSFWDTPKVFSVYEKENLANFQPVRNEFQRYAGHPATTSLSPILGAWLPVNGNYLSLKPYYDIAPRTKAGGSEAGTRLATAPISFTGADNQRLFATLDEMEFDPDRKSLPDSGIALSPEDLDQLRFFLTTSSRAPDVNLFNKPRVGIWPLHETNDANHRTVFDRLIAFCGTIGSHIFYFQRKNSNSSTDDLPVTPASSGVGRNRSLMNYLKKLTSENIPGFGGKFSTKYGTDRDQILTETFDYIRSTNLMDLNGGATGYQPFTPAGVSETKGTPGGGQVVPIYDTVTDTRGFGRFPTLSEAAFIFYATGDHDTDATIPVDHINVRAVFLPEMFTAALGWVTEYNDFKIQVEGLNSFTWAEIDPVTNTPEPDTSMGFPATASTYNVQISSGVTLVRLWGGPKGIRLFHHNKNFGTTGSSSSFPNISAAKLMFSGSNSTVTDPGTKFHFSGGDVTVKIFNSTGTEELQSITMNFPSGIFPVPRLTPDGSGLANGGINLRRFSTSTSDNGSAPESAQPYGRFRYFGSSDAASELKVAWITQWDTVRSKVARDGDIRLIAGRRTIVPGDGLFTELPDYSNPNVAMAHSLIAAGSHPYFGATRGKLVADAGYFRASSATNLNSITMSGGSINSSSGIKTTTWDMDVPYNGVALGKHAAAGAGDLPGDWDNGVGDIKDGPYINKPDEGTDFRVSSDDPPYFRPSNYRDVTSATFFSPNRQIPSAVMFGSLPSGVKANRPWQTLHFRPSPISHPGRSAPKDHLLLDLFHMPVVEPYAISEPLSTAGRINMNYQIQPFKYITRDTGIRAVLAKERILSVPLSAAAAYKDNGDPPVNPTPTDLRKDLNLDETMKGFEQRFAAGDLFRSASEICEIPLVPTGATFAGMATYWDAYPLTGDNSQERPYANIYPRLTTKSNVFTVHVRVQTLKKSKAREQSAPDEFDLAKGDRITGEYRGSTTIERYVDPNQAGLPDFADVALFDDLSTDLDRYYRFRTVGSKKFTP